MAVVILGTLMRNSPFLKVKNNCQSHHGAAAKKDPNYNNNDSIVDSETGDIPKDDETSTENVHKKKPKPITITDIIKNIIKCNYKKLNSLYKKSEIFMYEKDKIIQYFNKFDIIQIEKNIEVDLKWQFLLNINTAERYIYIMECAYGNILNNLYKNLMKLNYKTIKQSV